MGVCFTYHAFKMQHFSLTDSTQFFRFDCGWNGERWKQIWFLFVSNQPYISIIQAIARNSCATLWKSLYRMKWNHTKKTADAKPEDIMVICVVGLFMENSMKLLNMDKDIDVGDF